MVVGAAVVDMRVMLKGWFGWTLKGRLLTSQRRAGGGRGGDGSGGGGGGAGASVRGGHVLLSVSSAAGGESDGEPRTPPQAGAGP
eukprot:7164950-Pyramimonas_sp.AAC.1